jgi:integrase
MRTGEAVALRRGDVSLDAGVITVREAKHGRERLVPLNPTAAAALREYAAERGRLCPRPARERSSRPARAPPRTAAEPASTSARPP